LPLIDIPYTRFALANGLTVLVHEDHKAPVVAVDVWYHVGSKDEPGGHHGFAHLFEHLMFNGSQHYDDEYFRALEPAGATDMNGTTNTDRTNYFETVPTAALDRALWLESDRMGYLTGAISQAKLDEQRGVVENEKRQDENQPYGKVDEIIARETYPTGHPYSWTTIGSEKDLDAATLADVKNWFRSYYGPNNAVLVIAGDIDVASAKAKAEKYFGALPPGPPVPHVESWPAPLDGNKSMTVEDRVPLPRVYLTWNVPGDGRRDTVLLELAASVLANGRDSRLFHRLVYTDQIASSVAALVDVNEIGSQFHIVATALPGGSLAPIEKAIEEELAAFLRDGPTAAELASTKFAIYSGFVRGVDKVGGFSGKADLLAANETFHGDAGEYKRELAWQTEATPDDVRSAAQRWLGQTGRFALEVLPQHDAHAAGTDVDRSALPALGTAPKLNIPPFQRAVLSNGMKLIVVERHEVPAVDFSMLFDAGRAADAGIRSGTAALTMDMLDEGAGDLDALAISRRQRELGAGLSFTVHRDVSIATLAAIKPRLEASLDLYATILRDPKFPENELTRLKKQQLAAIVQERAQPFGLARRVLSRLLYGEGHPYAYAGLGLPEDVKAISRDDLVAFQRVWLRPDNATLVVTGDTTLAEIKPLLEAHLGGWAAPSTPLPKKNITEVPLPGMPRVFLLDKPDAEQSLVLAANLAPPADDPDAIAMQIVNTVLGGTFISRLNMDLRENKHWSYGASSFIGEARGQQIFAAYANVERAHTLDSVLEMRKELDAIVVGQPITPAETKIAKQTLVLALPGEFESTPELAAGVATLTELQLPDDYWNAYVPQVEQLGSTQLENAAMRLVKPQALTWIVVGDLARIEEPLRRANLGVVRVLDGNGRVVR
jgi:zinc protease